MGSDNCSSKFIADVFSTWHCQNSFMELLTLDDDQLIKWILLTASGCYLPS